MKDLVVYYEVNRLKLVKQAARRVNPAWAEDTVHNAFEEAIKSYNDGIQNFEAWFRTIFNRACNKMRKEMYGNFTEVSEEDWIETPSHDEEIFLKEVMREVSKRKSADRQILHCAFSLDLTEPQIAKITGESPARIEKVKNRFRAKMRKKFGKCFE